MGWTVEGGKDGIPLFSEWVSAPRPSDQRVNESKRLMRESTVPLLRMSIAHNP